MSPKPHYQDPMTGLWLPEGYDWPPPGYAQLPSGLWVPESAGGGCGWNMGTFKSAAKAFHGMEETEGEFGISPLASTMKAVDDIKAKMIQSMMAKMADFAHEAPPSWTKEQLDPMASLLHSPFPMSPLSASGILLAPEVESHVDRESTERAELEVALADFVTSKPARERLAELLWLGTEVCCLNLRRANERWKAEVSP